MHELGWRRRSGLSKQEFNFLRAVLFLAAVILTFAEVATAENPWAIDDSDETYLNGVPVDKTGQTSAMENET